MKGPSLAALRSDLEFLESRVNSRTDPTVQKLISRCQADILKAEIELRERRLVSLGHRRPYPPWDQPIGRPYRAPNGLRPTQVAKLAQTSQNRFSRAGTAIPIGPI